MRNQVALTFYKTSVLLSYKRELGRADLLSPPNKQSLGRKRHEDFFSWQDFTMHAHYADKLAKRDLEIDVDPSGQNPSKVLSAGTVFSLRRLMGVTETAC